MGLEAIVLDISSESALLWLKYTLIIFAGSIIKVY